LLIHVGYELTYEFLQATPMIVLLSIHESRAQDLVMSDTLTTQPWVEVAPYVDSFGNTCRRLVAPAGTITLSSGALVKDSGQADISNPSAQQCPVEQLPDEVLQFLVGSRYCETDTLSSLAWELFGGIPAGWQRVQAVCDFVHQHITFGYEHARPTKTAFEAFNDKVGVCRDFTHLAITFCRSLNIPARYCTGYLGDIGVTPPDGPMDFSAWFEAYLGNCWYVFDPRNNERRVGRVLMARGRDAADVPLSYTFGPNTLRGFKVWTEEVVAQKRADRKVN
jgi:transglutaminase-like putative cysteine protease